MKKPEVLFVCMGNICRSPAAEIVFRKVVAAAGLEGRIGIDSAGTIGYHAGDPPDRRMAATLRARGYPVAGRARQVVREDFGRFDLILPMDEDNEAVLKRLAPRNGTRARVVPFVRFCSEPGARHVPDPYYGGADGFERVADLVEDGCRGLLEHLRREMADP